MALDLYFPKRAVKMFIEAANNDSLGPRHISDIIKYEHADVTEIEPFLQSKNSWIRQCAAKVVAVRGDKKKLLEAAKVENDKSVLLIMLDGLTKEKEGIEELVHMLSSEDPAIMTDAIQMFRKAGRSDCLLSLAFSNDDAMVARVKRYMEEGDDDSEKEPGSEERV